MVSSAAGEVDADVLLAGNRQRGVLLVVVLNLQGGTVGHQSAIRQTNPQGRADLGTFNSKAVVVLFITLREITRLFSKISRHFRVIMSMVSRLLAMKNS
jgi:hypothetical protein